MDQQFHSGVPLSATGSHRLIIVTHQNSSGTMSSDQRNFPRGNASSNGFHMRKNCCNSLRDSHCTNIAARGCAWRGAASQPAPRQIFPPDAYASLARLLQEGMHLGFISILCPQHRLIYRKAENRLFCGLPAGFCPGTVIVFTQRAEQRMIGKAVWTRTSPGLPARPARPATCASCANNFSEARKSLLYSALSGEYAHQRQDWKIMTLCQNLCADQYVHASSCICWRMAFHTPLLRVRPCPPARCAPPESVPAMYFPALRADADRLQFGIATGRAGCGTRPDSRNGGSAGAYPANAAPACPRNSGSRTTSRSRHTSAPAHSRAD